MARISNRQLVADYLSSRQWASIGRLEWEELRAALPRVGENSLREALQDSGLAVRQPYFGIRQKSAEELEASLIEMERVYADAPELAALCRGIVIQAKDRARFASRNPKLDSAKRRLKEEMVRWMLVWLEDPSIFETWVRLRKQRLQQIDGLNGDGVAIERAGDLDL